MVNSHPLPPPKIFVFHVYSAIFSFFILNFYVVIQAAGGMHMVDPLFQRVLVNECQNKKIPVIFDEVFTGFWRLGTEVGLCFSLSP